MRKRDRAFITIVRFCYVFISLSYQLIDSVLNHCGQAKRTGGLFESSNPLAMKKFFRGLKVDLKSLHTKIYYAFSRVLKMSTLATSLFLLILSILQLKENCEKICIPFLVNLPLTDLKMSSFLLWVELHLLKHWLLLKLTVSIKE